MKTNLEALNEILKTLKIPDHRKQVPASLANLSWLRKNVKDDSVKYLLSLKDSQYKETYVKPE